MTGPQNTAQAAPTTGAASPCRCYSCDGQCDQCCGPLADVDGRPICEGCRARADVFDRDRTGANVTISQNAVRLNPDVFGGGGSLWLDARSARHLAEMLHRRAAELDLADAADRADLVDTSGAGPVGREVIGHDDDSPCPLVGTIVDTTEDSEWVMVNWGLGGGNQRCALDELAPRSATTSGRWGAPPVGAL